MEVATHHPGELSAVPVQAPDAPAVRSGPLRLHHSGHVVRVARGAEDRSAVHVHGPSGDLLDIAVTQYVPIPLRGGVRGGHGGRRWALAWGQLPADCVDFAVVFSGRGRILKASPTVIARSFWVAEVVGDFHTVSVAGDADRATRRLRSQD